MALQPFVGPGLLLSFIIFLTQTVGLERVISPSQGRYLHTGQHKNRITYTKTTMPWVGFKPMIQAFEQAKTVHALDRVATVIDLINTSA
jgi:hypothetical protein